MNRVGPWVAVLFACAANSLPAQDAATAEARRAANEHSQRLAMAEACRRGRLDIVRQLLESGADPNDGLRRVCGRWRVEILRLLIDKGADINAPIKSPDVKGGVPLHLAARYGAHEVVKLLLEAGADPNRLDQDKLSPLLIAVKEGNADVIPALLKAKADVNVTDASGAGALHHAVRRWSDDQTIQALVDAGADVELYDKKGYTPIRRAAIDYRCHSAHAIMLKANGGVERTQPRPRNPQRDQPNKTTQALLEEMIAAHGLVKWNHFDAQQTAEARQALTRFRAAEAALIERGEKIVPELLEAWSVPRLPALHSLLLRLGPDVGALIPRLSGLLTDRRYGAYALDTMEFIKPGCFAKLPRETRERAVAARYESIVAACKEEPLTEQSGPSAYFLNRYGEAAVPYFIKLLQSESETERLVALHGCSRSLKYKPIEREVLRWIRDRSSMQVRHWALDALQWAESSRDDALSAEAREALLAVMAETTCPPPPGNVWPDELNHPNSRLNIERLWRESQDQAATLLSRVGIEIIDDLLPLMAEGNCAYASHCLRNLDATAIPRLQVMLGDENPSISSAASGALSWIGMQDKATFYQGLDSPNERLIVRTALLLSKKRGASDAVPKLQALARDEQRSDAVRVAAAVAVVKLAPETPPAELACCVMPAARLLRGEGYVGHAGRDLLVALAKRDRSLLRSAVPDLRKALTKAPPSPYDGYQRSLRQLIETIEAP